MSWCKYVRHRLLDYSQASFSASHRSRAHSVLDYLLGASESYVVVATQSSVRVVPLTFDAEAAAAIGRMPGRLTAERVRAAFIKEDGSGILQQVADSRADVPAAKMAALWRTFVPEPERRGVSACPRRLMLARSRHLSH
jgi:hypothetical protein